MNSIENEILKNEIIDKLLVNNNLQIPFLTRVVEGLKNVENKRTVINIGGHIHFSRENYFQNLIL